MSSDLFAVKVPLVPLHGWQARTYAETPGAAVVLLAGALFMERRRLAPGTLMWSVLGAYALGRFAIFFGVRDVDVVALGLRQAQWTSIGLITAAVVGGLLTTGRLGPGPAPISSDSPEGRPRRRS